MLTEWMLIIIISTVFVENIGIKLFLIWVVIRNMIGYAEMLNETYEVYAKYTQSTYITAQTILIFVIFYEGIKRWLDDRRVTLILDVVCVVGILQTLMMIAQWNGLWVYIVPRGIKGTLYLGFNNSCLVGFTSNINMASSLLALCLPAFFRKKWLLFAPLVLLGLALSRSSGGIVPAVIFVLVYAIIKTPKKYRTHAIIGCIVLAAGMLLSDRHMTSFSGRVNACIVAIEHIIPVRPFIGWGTGQFKFAFPILQKIISGTNVAWRQLHNEYLQVIVEYGLIGFSFIVLALTQIMLKGARSKHRFILYGALFIGLLNSGVNFLFHTVCCVVLLIYCAILEKGDQDEEKSNFIRTNRFSSALF